MEKDSFSKIEKPVELRMAGLEDLEAIKNLRLKAVKEDEASFDEWPEDILEKTDEEWERIISGENEFVILGKKEDKAIGMLSATKDESFAYENERGQVKNVWYIRWGYLEPEFRKKPTGFAIQGLEEALRQIKQRGGEAVVLMVRAENEYKEAIVKIGKKYGFEIIEGKLRPGSVYMRLELVKT